jgi:hypothetical protein
MVNILGRSDIGNIWVPFPSDAFWPGLVIHFALIGIFHRKRLVFGGAALMMHEVSLNFVLNPNCLC